MPTNAAFYGDTSRAVPCDTGVLTPAIRADSHADALGNTSGSAPRIALVCNAISDGAIPRVGRESLPEIKDHLPAAMYLRRASASSALGCSAARWRAAPTNSPPVRLRREGEHAYLRVRLPHAE